VAQRRGVGKKANPLGQGDGRAQAPLQLKGEHSASRRHLAQGQISVRWLSSPGYTTRETAGWLSRKRAISRALCEWRAMRKGSVVRPRMISQALKGLIALQGGLAPPCGSGVCRQRARRSRRPGRRHGVQVLGGAVDDIICAQRQWLLQAGSGPRRVDGEQSPGFMGDCGDCLDIADAQDGVRRGFDVHEPGVGLKAWRTWSRSLVSTRLTCIPWRGKCSPNSSTEPA